jgi:hypothetical protein
MNCGITLIIIHSLLGSVELNTTQKTIPQAIKTCKTRFKKSGNVCVKQIHVADDGKRLHVVCGLPEKAEEK